MDPAKLKVVELRQELASRGLDQKGVKAVLVSRLQEALDAENAETPKSVSSESVESEQNNAEPSPPPVVGSPSNKLASEIPVDEESENLSDNPDEELITSDATEAVENVSLVASDPVPIIEKPQLAEESKPKHLSASLDEPMEVSQSETIEPIEHRSESLVDNKHNDDDGHQKSQVEVTAQKITEEDAADERSGVSPAADATVQPESIDTEPEVKSERRQAEGEVKVESGDEDKRSVTQSEDTKRDGESDSDRKDRKRRRSRSRSKSSSPTVKRSRRASPIQNSDDFTNVEDEPEIDSSTVLLSWFDSDLNLKVNSSEFLSARPISEGPLHMAWAGVRATHGVRNGKVSYEVLIDDLIRVHGLYDRNLHEIRCGWSVKTTDLQLGEAPLSFGYGGSGKRSLNNEFTEYGCKFNSRGDVIGVYLDLESEPCKIEYTVNGESQGVAFEFEKSELGDEALYPHILSKNTGFKVNFGQMEKPLVSKIKPKSKRDDRRESRRDRRSDRRSRSRSPQARRDRSRSRSRSCSRSRGDRKERSEDKEKSSSRKERSSEDDGENVANNETVVSASKDDEPMVGVQEKLEEKSAYLVQDEQNVADANGESQSKDAKEDSAVVPVEKIMLPDFDFIGKLPIEQLVAGFSRPDSRKDCEVILLIGLPGSGKSYWAKNFVEENIEKRFNILGVQPLLSKMTIAGEPRKKHVDGKWERFVDSCIRGVNIIQDIATKRRRNYIIDQTNVISSVQRRKIKGFGDFKRIAVVFIPDDDEYKQRLEKKLENEGKEVSEYSSDDMKANFSIPNSGCWFDEVQFVGLDGEEAKTKVAEYNEQGKKALNAHPSSYNRGSRDHNRRRRDDFRDNRDRDRRWGNDRRDGRTDWRSSQGWRGGGAGFDRRDRWHGGGGGGGGNWTNNYRGNNRYEDRDRIGGNSSGYNRYRDFGQHRRDDRRNENRRDRDFRDGNRERRLENKRPNDRGVPQIEKDEKHIPKHQPPSQNYKSTKADTPTQGHWNPNVVGPQANNWNNYYQQQNWGEYNQQQNWAQWNQQQGQPSSNYTTQQPQQDWSNWQPPTQPQPQQQPDVSHGGWQNWAQHAQTYGNAGDQPAPITK